MIAVLTHPRPISYLLATVESIDRSARGPRVVVSDTADHRPAIPRPWVLHSFDRPQTPRPENRWALWEALRLATLRSEDLIVFEDDVLLCRDSAVHAENLAVPADVAWISLYDPWFGAHAPHGLWRARAAGFSYAQGIKFPLRTCQALAGQSMARFDRAGSDDMLAAYGRINDWFYAVHVPSLIQHVGEVSAVGNGGLTGRTSSSFRAEYTPLTEDWRTFL